MFRHKGPVVSVKAPIVELELQKPDFNPLSKTTLSPLSLSNVVMCLSKTAFPTFQDLSLLSPFTNLLRVCLYIYIENRIE